MGAGATGCSTGGGVAGTSATGFLGGLQLAIKSTTEPSRNAFATLARRCIDISFIKLGLQSSIHRFCQTFEDAGWNVVNDVSARPGAARNWR